MIKVKVPATSANLGCGFDCLGVALSLYNEFTFEKNDCLLITGTDEKYANEDNLVFKSYKKVFEYLNMPLIYPSINVNASIPVSRGLGSSAACIVGGLLGANAILDYPLNEEEILILANSIEGHPDNVAPALLGGLCACSIYENNIKHYQFKIHENIHFIAFIPNFELSTSLSRSVLPLTVPFKDAINNVANLPLLLKGLEYGDKDSIRMGLNDKLHQPYRKPLVAEYEKIEEICAKYNEYCLYLSGAGPTLMLITTSLDNIPSIIEEVKLLENNWRVLPLKEMEGNIWKKNI